MKPDKVVVTIVEKDGYWVPTVVKTYAGEDFGYMSYSLNMRQDVTSMLGTLRALLELDLK